MIYTQRVLSIQFNHVNRFDQPDLYHLPASINRCWHIVVFRQTTSHWTADMGRPTLHPLMWQLVELSAFHGVDCDIAWPHKRARGQLSKACASSTASNATPTLPSGEGEKLPTLDSSPLQRLRCAAHRCFPKRFVIRIFSTLDNRYNTSTDRTTRSLSTTALPSLTTAGRITVKPYTMHWRFAFSRNGAVEGNRIDLSVGLQRDFVIRLLHIQGTNSCLAIALNNRHNCSNASSCLEQL